MNVTVDTLKFKTPSCHIASVDESYFETTMNPDTGMIKKIVVPTDNLKEYFGVNHIEIKPDGVIFIVSAKIRGRKYLRGINHGSIQHVLKAIENTGIIKFGNKQAVINSSDVLLCHVNLGVYLENIDNTLRMLNKYTMLQNWNSKLRLTNKDKSISFQQNVLHSPLLWKGYGKQSELAISANREFIIQHPNVYNKSENLFRCETNITSFKKIRRELGINDNKMKTVLSSNENVNLNVLNRITNIKMKPTIKTFESKKELSAYNDALVMLTQANFDLAVLKTNLIQQVPSLANSNNLSKQIAKYAEYASEIQNDIAQENGMNNDVLLDELKTKLHDTFNRE